MFSFAGRLALTLTTLLAAAVALVQARAASNLPPADNRALQIIYRAFSGMESLGSTYVMNADGSDVQPLSYNGQSFFQFACSGDGATLAFILSDQLYVLSAGSDAPRTVGDRQAGMLGVSLSSDGRLAALLTVEDQSRFVVHLLDVDSGRSTKLLETAMQMQSVGVASLTLAPDGARLLFEMPSFHPGSNQTAMAATTNLLEFDVADPASPRELGPGTAPGISPDGRVIAYSADGNLMLRDLATGVRVALRLSRRSPYGSGGIWEPAWSPDGRRIAAWSYLDQATIFVTDLDGNTGPARSTNGQRQVSPCFLASRPRALIAN